MGTTLGIGVSALLAAQKAIDTTGHNIANAHTPNFSRQRVELANIPPSRLGPLAVGGGVEPVSVEAVRDAFLDRLLLAQDPMAGAATCRSHLLSELETLFSLDPESSLGAAIDDFFNSFGELARNPAGAAERAAVVHSAQTLTSAFNGLGDRLMEFQRGLVPYVEETVTKVNELAEQIASLNEQIRDVVVTGGEANDLVDRRTTALRELASLLPISVAYDELQRADVRAGGLLLVAKDDATALNVTAEDGVLEVRIGDDIALAVAAGEVGTLLDVANRVVPSYLDHLDTLAAAIVREVNLRHSTGIGRAGSFPSLVGRWAVDDAVPLADAGLPFAVEAGTLYVSVIDQATGEVTQTPVAFDPATDTLADLAAALDAIDHLAANTSAGRLAISAGSGYRFDFANRVATAPGSLGTASVTLEGNVGLDADDTYTFTASGAGTIGATAGLTVAVTNAAGLTVAELDAGDGYAPGDLLELPGGLAVRLGAGDVAAGDALSAGLVAEPDASGILAALGLNTFFSGTSATAMAVEPAIAADPGLVAAGRSGSASDSSNALRLARVQDEVLASLGDDTVDGSYAELIGRVGLDAQMAQRGAASATVLLEAAENQRDAVSGVNEDEEALNLLRYQQLYTFAAKYIQTINELLDDLMAVL